jgi:hypothetical protein
MDVKPYHRDGSVDNIGKSASGSSRTGQARDCGG